MDSKIAYRAHGSGEIVVLLHGFAGSVGHWEPLRPLLSKYHQVIVPNLTHLTLGLKPLSFSAQVDELARFIRKFNQGRPVNLVGLSYGAALAWGLAIRYPELAQRLVFVNPMPPDPLRGINWKGLRTLLAIPFPASWLKPFFHSRWGQGMVKASSEIFRNTDSASTTDRLGHLEGRRLNFVLHILQRFSWILRTESWNTWQNKMDYWQHETMMIYEEQDPLIDRKSYQRFADLLGCDQIITTQGAGHISTINSPHLICWEVMKFLVDKKPKAAPTTKAG